MAVDKKSFVLYSDLIFTVSQLPNDKAGELFKHILMYVNDENPVTNDLIINISFEPIKQQLKRDLVKYECKKVQWSEAGKRSAELKALKKEEINQRTLTNVESRSTDSTVNDNVNVSVNVIKKNIEERKSDFKKSFTPFLENYNKIDLNEFFLYWTEHSINDKKMRFEKEKSFGIERRLATWMKNKEKFAVKDGKEKKQTGAQAFKDLVYGTATSL